MELLQLQYFCDAAERESFSATAKAYFVPPSAVSQSVKRLELELGVPLLVIHCTSPSPSCHTRRGTNTVTVGREPGALGWWDSWEVAPGLPSRWLLPLQG